MTGHRSHHPRAARRPRGFGAVAAIIVLVVLATISAAVVRLATGENTGQALDLQAARAYQAANAGLEWGLYQALKGSWTACSGSTHTTDLSTDLGMRVTVTCSASTYKDAYADSTTGAVLVDTIRVYTIEAVACNAPTSCPDAARATGPGYVERRRRVQVTDKFAP